MKRSPREAHAQGGREMTRVFQLKTGEDVAYANAVGYCPLCGKGFQLEQEVVEVLSEKLPWELSDGSEQLAILIHMDCLRKLL